MKGIHSKLVPLAVSTILLLSFVPAVFASTLTVNLNPTTGLAEVTSVSTTKIVLTYPNGSTLSDYLKSVNSSFTLNGTFQSGGDVTTLQTSLDEHDEDIRVQNMSVAVNFSAKGNDTALVVNKETDITAWVTGAFKVVNGTVQADLRWKSYAVTGPMVLNFVTESGTESQFDVNQVGPGIQESLGQDATASTFLFGAFGHDDFWGHPTLNYSALNTPLSTWTSNYNSLTNTTTYSKTITGTFTFSSSANFNGQVYTLSMSSDPSGTISVQGYATASGDSLTIQPTPMYLTPVFWAGSVAVIAIAGTAAYLLYRSRSHRPGPATPTAS